LVQSLVSLHGETDAASPANPPEPTRAPVKAVKKPKGR
jgi:hypothetical protein